MDKRKMGVFTVFKYSFCKDSKIVVSPNSVLTYSRENEIYKISINGYVTKTTKEELQRMCDFLELEFVE